MRTFGKIQVEIVVAEEDGFGFFKDLAACLKDGKDRGLRDVCGSVRCHHYSTGYVWLDCENVLVDMVTYLGRQLK